MGAHTSWRIPNPFTREVFFGLLFPVVSVSGTMVSDGKELLLKTCRGSADLQCCCINWEPQNF